MHIQKDSEKQKQSPNNPSPHNAAVSKLATVDSMFDHNKQGIHAMLDIVIWCAASKPLWAATWFAAPFAHDQT